MIINAMNPFKYMAAYGQFWGDILMCGMVGEYDAFNRIKARCMKKIGGR
jgi:hypothetical protein